MRKIAIKFLTISGLMFIISSNAQAVSSPNNMVLIKEGDFILGSDKKDVEGRGKEFDSIKPWYLDEHPEHKAHLKSFYVDQYEVTNKDYRDFVKKSKYPPPRQWIENGYIVSMRPEKLKTLSVVKLRRLVSELFQIDIDARKMNKPDLIKAINKHFEELDKLPVTYVNWYGANAFCKAQGKHLPTEAQWEAADRGYQGNEFPWGNKFQYNITNTGEQDWVYGVAPVGSYPEDKSPFDVYDMAGNVSEWVEDWYEKYQGGDFNSDAFGHQFKVIRGAAWGGSGHYALQHYQRGAFRLYVKPDAEYEDLGFRCAIEAVKMANH